MIPYTEDQLIRETQLLLAEVALLADFVIDDGAGLRALELDEDGHFGQTRHPDDLVDLDRYAVWRHIRCVERYVQQQKWSASLPVDVLALGVAVERIFSPAILDAYEEERLAHPVDGAVPGAHEDGAGDVALGHFHRGILAELVALASARLKMDLGERLTMGEIARLLGVREATVVTNAHRHNFASVEDGNRRYAEPADVLPWMLKNGYRPTDKEDSGSEVALRAATVPDDVLFVPVARDGSWFSPEVASGGRYTIGEKGAERKFTDYFEALAALLQMPTPRWRRPNADGHRGIVAGVRFDRVRRAELERLLPAAASQAESGA